MADQPQLTMDDIDEALEGSGEPIQIDEAPDEPDSIAEIDEKALAQRVESELGNSRDAYIPPSEIIANLNHYKQVAAALAFGSRDPKLAAAQMFQRMFVGSSMGMSMASALLGMHVMDGRVSLSAHLIAARLRAGGWDLVIEESDPPGEWCRVTAKQEGHSPVSFKYTMDMAKQQKLVRQGGAWEKNPWDMLYARCVATVGRRAEPGGLTGCYAPAELMKSADSENRGSRERLG